MKIKDLKVIACTGGDIKNRIIEARKYNTGNPLTDKEKESLNKAGKKMAPIVEHNKQIIKESAEKGGKNGCYY